MERVNSTVCGILGEAKQVDIDNKRKEIANQIKSLTDQKRKLMNEMSVLSRTESICKSMANTMDRTKNDLDNASKVKVNKQDIGPTADARINGVMTAIIDSANMANNQSIMFRKQIAMCESDINKLSDQVKNMDSLIKKYKDELTQLDKDEKQLKKNGVTAIRAQSVQDGIDSLRTSQ